MVRVCELCGQEFEATGRNASRRKYCNAAHHATCQYCGKQFEITSTHLRSGQIPKCCSKECSSKLKIQKCKDAVKAKYGVDNISQNCSNILLRYIILNPLYHIVIDLNSLAKCMIP